IIFVDPRHGGVMVLSSSSSAVQNQKRVDCRWAETNLQGPPDRVAADGTRTVVCGMIGPHFSRLRRRRFTRCSVTASTSRRSKQMGTFFIDFVSFCSKMLDTNKS